MACNCLKFWDEPVLEWPSFSLSWSVCQLHLLIIISFLYFYWFLVIFLLNFPSMYLELMKSYCYVFPRYIILIKHQKDMVPWIISLIMMLRMTQSDHQGAFHVICGGLDKVLIWLEFCFKIFYQQSMSVSSYTLLCFKIYSSSPNASLFFLNLLFTFMLNMFI